MTASKTQTAKGHDSTLWAICTFFNPASYRTKLHNYQQFRQQLQLQHVPLLTVECAFENQPFSLTSSDADILIQVRSRSILWQKEHLLNLALDELPSQCINIAWLDCDVILQNPRWANLANERLETHAVVQLFEWAIRLQKWQKTKRIPRQQYIRGFASFAEMQAKPWINYNTEGGFAWAIKREIIEAVGFYDRAIIGGGDWILNHGFYGFKHADSHAQNWVQQMYGQTQGKCTFIPGNILHLYHGKTKNRQYADRMKILTAHRFNPENDVGIGPTGCLEWQTEKVALHNAVRQYFQTRQEDDMQLIQWFQLTLKWIEQHRYSPKTSHKIAVAMKDWCWFFGSYVPRTAWKILKTILAQK